MKRISSRLLLATVIAVASTLALAQPMQGPQGGGMDRETVYKYRTEFFELRMAEFKALLKLAPEQEAAWKSLTAVMQPLPQPMRLTPAERSQLTPEQRAEWMQQRDAFRQARTGQRGEAIAAFRAQLTPEQQQTFDQYAPQYQIQSAPQGGMRGGMQGGGMGRGMRGGGMGGGMGGRGMGGNCGGAPSSCAQ
jgi:hypothetical protein